MKNPRKFAYFGKNLHIFNKNQVNCVHNLLENRRESRTPWLEKSVAADGGERVPADGETVAKILNFAQKMQNFGQKRKILVKNGRERGWERRG